MVAADSVLLPVQAAYLPVKGLQQLIKTISMVKRRLNRRLMIEGILLTIVDFRTNYAKDISSKVRETETLFNIPGLGMLTLSSINRRDVFVIQGVVLFVTLLYVIVNLTVDVLYGFVDPRLRPGLK